VAQIELEFPEAALARVLLDASYLLDDPVHVFQKAWLVSWVRALAGMSRKAERFVGTTGQLGFVVRSKRPVMAASPSIVRPRAADGRL